MAEGHAADLGSALLVSARRNGFPNSARIEMTPAVGLAMPPPWPQA